MAAGSAGGITMVIMSKALMATSAGPISLDSCQQQLVNFLDQLHRIIDKLL